MHFLGIDRVGVNGDNSRKLLLSAAFVVAVPVVSKLLRALLGPVLGKTDHASRQVKFWIRQAVSLVAAIVMILRGVKDAMRRYIIGEMDIACGESSG